VKDSEKGSVCERGGRRSCVRERERNRVCVKEGARGSACASENVQACSREGEEGKDGCVLVRSCVKEGVHTYIHIHA